MVAMMDGAYTFPDVGSFRKASAHTREKRYAALLAVSFGASCRRMELSRQFKNSMMLQISSLSGNRCA